jgi:hypothetical protein
MTECTHLDQVKNVKPHTHGCEECLKMGDTLLCCLPGRGTVESSMMTLWQIGWNPNVAHPAIRQPLL